MLFLSSLPSTPHNSTHIFCRGHLSSRFWRICYCGLSRSAYHLPYLWMYTFVQICGGNDTFKRAVRIKMSTDCPCLHAGVLFGSQLERCWRCWKTWCSHDKLSRRESVWCWAEWCWSAQLGPLLTLSQWSQCSHHSGLWQKPNNQKQLSKQAAMTIQCIYIHQLLVSGCSTLFLQSYFNV